MLKHWTKHVMVATLILLTELAIMTWVFEKFQKGMLLSVAGNCLMDRGFIVLSSEKGGLGDQVSKFVSHGGELHYQVEIDDNRVVIWKRNKHALDH